jgi:hypothetical protein
VGLFIALSCFSACSDIGTEPWSGWPEYDLPYAQIYLPPELVRATSMAARPENPDFVGVADGQRIRVQFCIYTTPIVSSFREYVEGPIILEGKPAVLFRGLGLFHLYDSSFRQLMGVRAYFDPDGSSVVVLVAVESESGYNVARRILMSLHSQSRNTGHPV